MSYFVFYGDNDYDLQFECFDLREECLKWVQEHSDTWENVFVIAGKQLEIVKTFGFAE